MSFIRPKKKEYTKRPVRGDHKLTLTKVSKEAEISVVQTESLYDDAVKLALLERSEKSLNALEDYLDKAMADLNILISPEHTQLVHAISVLQGEATLVLDGELIERAINISMNSFALNNGMDPVAMALGTHGAADGIPLAPVPNLFMNCRDMEDLKGFPSPGDPQYKLKPIDDLSIEVKEANSFEILGKLWRILKYFPGTDIAAFMENLKFRPILNIVQNVIDWVNCNMVYPALGMLTGEVRTCQDPTGKKKLIEPTDTVLPNADDFVGTGLDCSAAAAEVLTYCDLKLRDNREVRALFMAKEQRNEHEASKFGVLCNGIRNKKHYADRIEKLYDSTKKIPMYKKRYYDHKDTYSVTQQYQMLSLEEFTTTTEEQ